jgi:hypothetical protein
VNLHHSVPFIDAHVHEHAITHDSRIGNDRVKTTEGIDGALHEAASAIPIGDVVAIGDRFAAALAMGAVMYFLNDLFQPYTTGASLIRWAAMAVLVGTGALVYAAAVFATGALKPRDIRQLLRSQS